MTTVVYVPMPQGQVKPYLGNAWPPAEGATVLRVPESVGVSDGAVIVYEVDGMPGTTWWLLDGVIPPQDAGAVDESLAALVPESVLETWTTEQPPETPPHSSSSGSRANDDS